MRETFQGSSFWLSGASEFCLLEPRPRVGHKHLIRYGPAAWATLGARKPPGGQC